MAFKNQVVAKTDASTRQGEGSGLAFELRLYDSFGVEDTVYSDKKYVPKKITTTQAETYATVFAMDNIKKSIKLKNFYPKDFEVIIESDCQHTVRRINENEIREDVDKFINHYNKIFGEMRARWIPRSQNAKADSMAREMFRKGTEGEL